MVVRPEPFETGCNCRTSSYGPQNSVCPCRWVGTPQASTCSWTLRPNRTRWETIWPVSDWQVPCSLYGLQERSSALGIWRG